MSGSTTAIVDVKAKKLRERVGWARRLSHVMPNQSGARDRAVLAAALDPIVTIDVRGMILSISDSVRSVFGYEPHEVIGQNMGVLLSESCRPAHDGYIAKRVRVGAATFLGRPRQFEAVRKNGTVFPIELRVSKADVVGSDEPVFVGIFRDMTDHNRVLAELGAQKQYMETLVEHMPLIVFRLDRNLRHLYIGGAVHRISNLKPAQFIGKTGRELGFQSRLCDRFEAACRKLLSTQRSVEIDFRIRNTWIHYSLIPELGADGKTHTILGLAEDITPRKAYERWLSKSMTQLEKIVAKRTEELHQTHEQIRISDRLASIGTLAAGLGHDMNNVLLPIRAHLNAVLAADVDQASRRRLSQVQRSIDYLQNLSDGLHYLATDPSNVPETSAKTNLVSWWQQTGPLLVKALPKHVDFHVSIPGIKTRIPSAMPDVAIAPHMLTQAVLNLIINAGQAVQAKKPDRSGAPKVHMDARIVRFGTKKAIQSVKICVSDNGSGMSEEIKQRAFEMFFTTKPRGLGTGLGLPLVRRIVESAGGACQIKSTPNRGTKVALIFPIVGARGSSSLHQNRERIVAAISIPDGRTRELLGHLIQAHHLHIAEKPDQPGITLWILDPVETELETIHSWMSLNPQGRAVLLRQAPEAQMPLWTKRKPILIENHNRYESIRQAIQKVLKLPILKRGFQHAKAKLD